MATFEANSVVTEAASVIRNMRSGAGRLESPARALESVLVKPVFCNPYPIGRYEFYALNLSS